MSEWIDLSVRQPPKGMIVLLKFKSGIVCSGRERYGNLGEPNQDSIEWRCDCCGRFATPEYWMPMK